MRTYKPKTVMVLEDQREWWAAKLTGPKQETGPMRPWYEPAPPRPRVRLRVTCCGCGELAFHFEANYDPKLCLFTVPYAGANGGIGREHDADGWEDLLGKKGRAVFLSECCYAPRFTC